MKFTAAIVLTVASLALLAQKPITGAFGYKLGEALKNDSVIRQIDNLNYLVKVEKPFRKFRQYCVSISPFERKIYAVVAHYSTNNKDGEEEFKFALASLENIYGKFEKDPTQFRPVYRWNHNGRTIVVTYERPSFQTERVMILYIDNALHDQAQKELKALQVQNTDTSML